jgi:outer membrane protein TolC
VLLLLAAAPAVAAGQQFEVSLDEEIERALRAQPSIVQARGDQRNAAADRRAALGAFLPTVTTSWGAARSNVGRIDNTTGRPIPPEYVHTLGLNANVVLFDALGRYSGVRAANALSDAADAGYVRERFAVILTTKRAFYDERSAEILVQVEESRLRRAQQQRQIAIERLRAGSATRSDSLRAEVEYGNAQLALLEAQATLAFAQASLGRQIGVEGRVKGVGEVVFPAFPDTIGLRAEIIGVGPDVRRSEALARSAAADQWATRSTYFPTINVSYGDSRQGTGWPEFFGFDSYTEVFTWRFGLSWTLFNGFARETQNTAASVRSDVADAQSAETRRQVDALLTQDLAALVTSRAAIEIARATLAAAQEDYRVQSERYRVGASTILDLLTSQAALADAERTLLAQNYDYVIAVAVLEALAGRVL